jgi:hypothetical protein
MISDAFFEITAARTFARSIVSNANFLSLSRLSMLLSDAPAVKDGGEVRTISYF